MRKNFFIFLAISLSIPIFVLSAASQEKTKAVAAHNLFLEVTFYKGKSPASQTLPASGAKSWSWFSLFRKTPDYKPAAGTLPVRAVNIATQMEGVTTKIRVSVFTGEKFHDKEEFVADYTIKENEKVVIEELSKFGVEPFELAVVRTEPTVADLPTIVNNSDSIEVRAEPNYSTLPTFKAKLKNNSTKAVSAFTFETKLGNRRMLSGMPQGKLGRALIAPGEIYETIIDNNLQSVKNVLPNADTLSNLTLIISSVIFEDGTYEGDLHRAALYLTFSLGRKLMLEKVLAAWKIDAKNESPTLIADKLTRKLIALNDDVDELAFAELLKKFLILSENEKNTLRPALELSIKGTKKDIVVEINELLRNQTAETFNVRLAETRQKYQDWLERLSK